jgi:hypothetical protein
MGGLEFMGNKQQELDLNMLDEAFGLNYNDIPAHENAPALPQREEVNINFDDPVDILKGNIKKANQILDKIQDEIDGGNFTARMVEVAGNIINGITAASKEIIGKDNYDGYLEIRKELKNLKEREVVIKEKTGLRRTGNTNQNIIVTSREDLLKIMSGKEPKKIGEGEVIEIEEVKK